MALPLTAQDGQSVYSRPPRTGCSSAGSSCSRTRPPERKRQLELNIKVYETLVNEEPANKPMPIKFQV